VRESQYSTATSILSSMVLLKMDPSTCGTRNNLHVTPITAHANNSQSLNTTVLLLGRVFVTHQQSLN